MKIKEIREINIPLEGEVSNSIVSFSDHDVSLVAVISDVIRNGKPVIGYGFNSIGRYAQSGIIRDRIIPRLISAKPESLQSDSGFDCEKVFRAAMKNEKPGGHGDRASAIGAVELAFWDLNAKLADEPAYQTIARHFGRTPSGKVPVYAAGGYYYDEDGLDRLKDELKGYVDIGFDAFKMKIGGAPLAKDMERIQAALDICKSGARLAVDANGRFDFETAIVYGKEIAPLNLRWYEEVGDPLDFALNSRVAAEYSGALATGENLFSGPDVQNLLNFGGMRPCHDIFQIDAGLSYGLSNYARSVALLEQAGFGRKFIYPHGGHLINLHIVCGMNLGGCEAYPSVFQPFGGYSPECKVADGFITPADHPGFGLEAKANLRPLLEKLSV